MAMDNTALIRRFAEEVWNKGNLDVCDELVSPKIKTHDPLMKDIEGLEATKQHVRLFRTAFPDFRMTIEDIGSVGDKVYVRWSATGTHKGTLLGLAPTNRRGVVQGITINRIESGRIVETYYAWDIYGFMEQLGMLPALEKFARSQTQPAVHA